MLMARTDMKESSDSLKSACDRSFSIMWIYTILTLVVLLLQLVAKFVWGQQSQHVEWEFDLSDQLNFKILINSIQVLESEYLIIVSLSLFLQRETVVFVSFMHRRDRKRLYKTSTTNLILWITLFSREILLQYFNLLRLRSLGESLVNLSSGAVAIP